MNWWYPGDQWQYDATAFRGGGLTNYLDVLRLDADRRTEAEKRADRRKAQQYSREKIEDGKCTDPLCRVPVVAFIKPYTQTWVLVHGECELLFWRAEDHEKVWYSDSGPYEACSQYHAINFEAIEEEWTERVLYPERGIQRRILWHAGESV